MAPPIGHTTGRRHNCRRHASDERRYYRHSHDKLVEDALLMASTSLGLRWLITAPG